MKPLQTQHQSNINLTLSENGINMYRNQFQSQYPMNDIFQFPYFLFPTYVCTTKFMIKCSLKSMLLHSFYRVKDNIVGNVNIYIEADYICYQCSQKFVIQF